MRKQVYINRRQVMKYCFSYYPGGIVLSVRQNDRHAFCKSFRCSEYEKDKSGCCKEFRRILSSYGVDASLDEIQKRADKAIATGVSRYAHEMERAKRIKTDGKCPFCAYPIGTRLHVTNCAGRVMVGFLVRKKEALCYLSDSMNGEAGAENAFAHDAIIRLAFDDEPNQGIRAVTGYHDVITMEFEKMFGLYGQIE